MSERLRTQPFPLDRSAAFPNGSASGGRAGVWGALAVGILAGALAGVLLVPRLQLLNLGRVGTPVRPALAAALAGAVAGALLLGGAARRRPARHAARRTALLGIAAGTASLWIVYAIVRLQVPVLFVERSVPRVVAADLGLLVAFGAPAGALAATGAARGRRLLERAGARRRRRPR